MTLHEDLLGVAARLELYLLLWRTNATSALLRAADRDRIGQDLAVYVIDVLDPVGSAIAEALHLGGRAAAVETVIRSAQARTPPERPLLWGVDSAAELADLVNRSAPHLEGFTAQIREPAHEGHVRALVVAGLGAELIQVPHAGGALHPSPDIPRPCDPLKEGQE